MKARDVDGQEFGVGAVVELCEPLGGCSYDGLYEVVDVFELAEDCVGLDLESVVTVCGEPLSMTYGYAAELVKVVRA